ncbi:MAG: hypothetical protein NT154_16110 [Verrucomicrobia bacterium]|nr:hypothetical protein [Verrucomicrobiota bacterium]
MNRISREIVRSLREMEKNLGRPTFNWAGADYACCPNEATASKILGLGGFALTADLLLFVRKSELPAAGPQVKQTLSFSGKLYQIEQIGVLPGEEVITLACNDAAQEG